MNVLKRTLDEILTVIGRNPIESGGIIGCNDGCICAFAFDDSYTSSFEYVPNTEYLNRKIKEWNGEGISFCGIVHSHLYGFNFPSASDKSYAMALLRFGVNIKDLYFPIVTVDDSELAHIDFYGFMPQTEDFVRLSLIDGGAEYYELAIA